MSRSRLIFHGRLATPTPPPAGLTLVDQPQMSGIPREGKAASIWAGSYSGGTPTHYRFKIYRDSLAGAGPVLVGSIVQTTEEYAFNWASADKGTLTSATVEASGDNQATWTAAVEPYYSFYPDTQLIEAAIPAPDLVATRTSGAGPTPVTFTIAGTILPSYEWEVVKLNSDFLTETYRGRKPVTEYEIANLVIDLDGATGPILFPPMSAFGATEIGKIRSITQDWNENGINPGDNSGAAGPWVGISATDFGGHQFYKLAIASNALGAGGDIVMAAVELAESVGGPNLLRDLNVFYSVGAQVPSPPGGTTYQSDHIFDGLNSTYGGLNGSPVSLIFDMLVPRPIVRLRIRSYVGNYQQAPAAFAIGPCLANGTYIGSPTSVSGVAFSNSADQTLEWSF